MYLTSIFRGLDAHAKAWQGAVRTGDGLGLYLNVFFLALAVMGMARKVVGWDRGCIYARNFSQAAP